MRKMLKTLGIMPVALALALPLAAEEVKECGTCKDPERTRQGMAEKPGMRGEKMGHKGFAGREGMHEGGREGMREGGPDGMQGELGGAEMLARAVMNPEIAEKLGLSEEQREAIKNGLHTIRQQQIELRAKMELAALEQAKLLTEENTDEAKLMSAIEKTGAANTELAKLRVKPLLLMKSVLTEEQRASVRTLLQEKRKQREGGEKPWASDERMERGERGEDRPRDEMRERLEIRKRERAERGEAERD